MSPISDVLLTNLANTCGTLAVVGIVAYQFLEINAKREQERRAAEQQAGRDETGFSTSPPPPQPSFDSS
ncbi:hypothetical protein JCM8547_000437 [Rhodosporidiobolus lusitaniae]